MINDDSSKAQANPEPYFSSQKRFHRASSAKPRLPVAGGDLQTCISTPPKWTMMKQWCQRRLVYAPHKHQICLVNFAHQETFVRERKFGTHFVIPSTSQGGDEIHGAGGLARLPIQNRHF